ncbi:MAG: PD40 domain-containing protein [Bacteroidetes bacterium]|nr:PD40 domain-containing protein [Bacteroidota bacterium]
MNSYKSFLNRILLATFFLSAFVILSEVEESFSQPLSKSQFRQYFTQGNLMMMDNFPDTAVRTFLTLYKADASNANVNYKIGLCYLRIPSQKLKSIPYLENAIKQTNGAYREDDPSEKNAPEDALYYLGQAYHYAYRFDEAIEKFKQFREIIGKWNLNLVKEVDHWIEVSENAKQLTMHPVECTITNLGDSVNSEFADYSPCITADESELILTSRREGTGGPDNKTIDDLFFEDIFICKNAGLGTWTKAKGISRTINTDGNEASIGLSADGQQLYVYRDDNGDGNIYISKLDGDYWNAPYKLDAGNVNTASWEPSACISADGNTMYFVSNRSGGFGGRDIYKCHRLQNRGWSEAENLGPTINTPYDEDAPFIHPDGITLFFSSTGHNSMGGFDVFYSTKVSDKVWTKPINMGYPINTTDDDIYFVSSSDGRRAYYSSFRPGGKGEKDIYMVTMPKPFVLSVAILVGYLKYKNGTPIPKYSSVTVKNSKGENFSSHPNEATGKFLTSLIPNQEYEITVEVNTKKVFSDKFFLPEDSSYQNLGRGFFMDTIYIGDTTRLFSRGKVKIDTTVKIKMVALDGKLLFGKNPEDIAANVTLHLLNSAGNEIASAVTDSKGKFMFSNVPEGQKFIIKIDENDPVLSAHQQFYLAADNGQVLVPSVKEERFFLFKNISPDYNKLSSLTAVDHTPVLASMKGKISLSDDRKKSASKITVALLDKEGKVVQSKTTDNTGKFSFDNIDSEKNYTLSIKDSSHAIKNNIYLLNEKQEIIRTANKVGDYFIFENLPTDLNKLSALSMVDSTRFIAMKGKMLKSTEADDGIRNLIVTLSDSKGKMQQVKTDSTGGFKFDKLSADKNYSLKLNEKDSALKGINKVYLANEEGKAVKVVYIGKGNSFSNLPANLMKMEVMKVKEVASVSTAPKENLNVINKEVKFPGDEKFDFVIYFPYNKKEIDVSISSYIAMLDKLSKSINEYGKTTVTIFASASKVPTTMFGDNNKLAGERSKEIKDRIHASISFKNLDENKITFEAEERVQGPDYKNDAVANKKEYEKWQFVKVIVK